MISYFKTNILIIISIILTVVFFIYKSYNDWAKEKRESQPRFNAEFNDTLDQWSFTNVGAQCFDLDYELSNYFPKEISFSKSLKNGESIVLRVIFEETEAFFGTEIFFKTNTDLTITLSFADSVNNRYKQVFKFQYNKYQNKPIGVSNPPVIKKRKQ